MDVRLCTRFHFLEQLEVAQELSGSAGLSSRPSSTMPARELARSSPCLGTRERRHAADLCALPLSAQVHQQEQIAAGVTDSRDACPIVSGRCWLKFWLHLDRQAPHLPRKFEVVRQPPSPSLNARGARLSSPACHIALVLGLDLGPGPRRQAFDQRGCARKLAQAQRGSRRAGFEQIHQEYSADRAAEQRSRSCWCT